MEYCKVYTQNGAKIENTHEHKCDAQMIVYEHGTHFVFPAGMLKVIFPFGSGLFEKTAFSAAKRYPDECKNTRIDIDRRMTDIIKEWVKCPE